MSEQILTKRCSKCKQTKSLSEFTKDRSAKDGIRRCCKSCIKAYKKVYNQTPNVKAAHCKATTKYHQTPNGKAVHRKAFAKWSRTSKGKEARRKADAKRKARHPNKIKAKNAVNHAIEAGRLPRVNTLPCHYCSAQAEQYHHFLGYEPEHWLDVIPACRECHRKDHRKIA